MIAGNKRHSSMEALAALVALLHLCSIFSAHSAVQAAAARPRAPTVVSVTSLDPAKFAVCAQAGGARSRAGCGLLTVRLQPPSPAKGTAAVTGHRITCVPAGCPYKPAQRGQAASAASAASVPMCPPQIQKDGVGVPERMGQKQYLQYKLKLPVLAKYVRYHCWAMARNKAGWGPASKLKAATLPPSPPSVKPSSVLITSDAKSGNVVVHLKAPRAIPGITGVLVRGHPSGGSRMIEAVGKRIAGNESLQVTFARGQYQEDTVYILSAHFTTTPPGSAQQLLGAPAVEDYRTPMQEPTEAPPGPPAAPTLALSFLSPATSPACRDAAAVGHDACKTLTLTVTPPTSNGGADITQYLVVCKPICSSTQGRRRLRSQLDPCYMGPDSLSVRVPPTVQGQGTPVEGGKLQFQLALDDFASRLYQCNATALNKLGWGTPSQPQTFTPPTKPPARAPSINSVVQLGSKVKVCLRPLLSDSTDATSVLIEGKLDDGTVVLTAPGPISTFNGSPVCITAELEPGVPANTLIHISCIARKTDGSITFSSKPSAARDLLTLPE